MGDYLPLDKAALRWILLFRHPAGVGREEADEWFTRIQAPRISDHPSLLRFLSFRTLEPRNVPGRWRPDTVPEDVQIQNRWDRMMEMWFETFDDWREWVSFASSQLEPTWRTTDRYPFVEPFVDFVSTFVLERPNDDFLRDSRGYVP